MGKVRDKKNRKAAKTLGEQMKRRKMLVEVRQEAAEFTKGLRRGMDPADAIGLVLDNMTTAYEYATQRMMELDEDEYWETTISGRKLNHWIVEQERLGLQIVHTAAKAASMGIAARQIQLQEQQAALFATVVDAALIKAGIESDTRQVVHQGIASGLEDIEGTAEVLSSRTTGVLTP